MQVLLIDDDEDERRLAAVLLAHAVPDLQLVEVGTVAGYAESLYGGPFVVAIAPLSTAWGEGASLLAAVRRRHPGCATILLGNLSPEALPGVLATEGVDEVLARSGRGLTRLESTVRALVDARRDGAPPARAGSAPPCGPPAVAEEEPRAVMAALCHDLQDPLQVILHTVRGLKPGADPGATPREMQRILGNAERMQAVLDALAEGDDLSSRPLRMQSVDLDTLLDEVLHDLEARDACRGVDIRRTPLPTVVGDATHLRRLLENLVGNALKFRGAEPASLALQAIERPGEWLLTVADNGIGIAPEDAERVFSMFVRLHGPHDYPGSGVGLAICRRIARAHGGEIWVQSTPGGGATFVVALPKRRPGEPEAPPA